MTHGEKRINAIITNVAKGAYTVEYLKDLLARGLQHVDCYGAKNIDKKFLVNLCHIEAAIARTERDQHRRETN